MSIYFLSVVFECDISYSGACGLVKLAVRKSDCLRVACKCIDKSKFNFPTNSSKVSNASIFTLAGLAFTCSVGLESSLCYFHSFICFHGYSKI